MSAPPVARPAGLATVLVRIDRAKLHLADYEARTKPYLAECARAVSHEYDEQRSEYVVRVNQMPESPTQVHWEKVGSGAGAVVGWRGNAVGSLPASVYDQLS